MTENVAKQQWSVRRSLVVVALLFFINETIGTVIAIQENLPSVTLVRSGLPAWEDFLIGFGTALSAPLVLWLALIVCIVLSFQSKRPGTVGAAGLVILGLAFTVGSLAETITYRVLNPATFDLPKALVVIAHIILSLLLVGLGSRVLARKRQISLTSFML